MSSSVRDAVPASHHIPALDGWRGLAIVLVLLGHFGLDATLPGFASFGVDLFFVLSGRLMADILFVKRMPLAQFYLRRLARIYPAFLVFLVCAGFAFSSLQPGYTVTAAIYALTFSLNYAVASGILPFTIFDHIWSLCVEEHSYMLLGLIALLCRSFHRNAAAAVLILIGLAAMMNGIIELDGWHYNEFQTLWRTDVALAAIFLSAGLFILLPQDGSRSTWLTPLGLASASIAQFSGAGAVVTFGCEILLLSIAALGIEHSSRWFKAFLETKTLRFMGRCSFSIYLWQEPFYKTAVRDAFPHQILLLGGLACGILSYYVVERPARSMLNDLFDRWFSAHHVFWKPPLSP